MIARGCAALAGIAMLILLAVYIATSGRIATVHAAGRAALLTPSGMSPATADIALPVGDARAAVINDPMNQRMLNAAMLATARVQPGSIERRWFAALAKLGWRDTPSRQNLMVRHAQEGEVVAALDDLDALLRRNQLIDQITPVLLLAESDPAWRTQVVERLRQRPSWRFSYLQRGSLIVDPVLLAARAGTIRTLQRSGDDVAAGEIAPFLPNLLAANLGSRAFAIWQAREPFIARPVADPSFARLALERQPSTVPFHWQLTNGPDYSVNAELRHAPQLTLSWNGTGAPIFAMQHISAPAGRYAVVLTAPEPNVDVQAMVGVRAVCGTDVVDFARPRQVSLTRVSYAAERAVPCAYPRLELFGKSAGSGPRNREAAISHVAIAPAI